MGVQITELLPLKEIHLNELSGKVIAIDAPIFLYQFLTTIRQRDGTLLMDSKGNVTSHLSGIFFRTVKLIENGIKPVYVFDGKPPEQKRKEQERRASLKKEAALLYEQAVKEEDVEAMRKFAARTAKVTREMVSEAKELLGILGIPVVEAASEAEAQASFLVKEENAFAIASQDADALLFGAPRLVRNLSVFGRRKKQNKLTYETVNPEMVVLADVLNNLWIDHEQLIAMSLLVGTDYNYNGIKGIGPKNALKLVKKHGSNFEALFEDVKWKEFYDVSWREIFELIKNMPINENYNLEWKPVDENKLIEFLVERHDFSEERVKGALEGISFEKEKRMQRTLGEF